MKKLPGEKYTHRLRAGIWRAVAYTLAGDLAKRLGNKRLIDAAETVDHMLINRQELAELLAALNRQGEEQPPAAGD